MENPKASIRKAPPIRDRGTATAGTRAARMDPRLRKITSRTMSTASANVVKTSSMESLMKALAS